MPHLINGPRRRRIAAGSGTSIEEVNRLLAVAQADGEDDALDGEREDADPPARAHGRAAQAPALT